MSVGVAVRHTLRAHFCSSTTLGVAVYLHSPQTEVCPLCIGVVLGTTIGIVAHCISRPLFLPGTTLSMPSIFTALILKSICCVPGLWVPLAQPSTLSSVFVTLRLESVHCVLRYPLSYNLRRRCLLPPKDLLCAQHNSRHCRMSL